MMWLLALLVVGVAWWLWRGLCAEPPVQARPDPDRHLFHEAYQRSIERDTTR